jgi:hypothetical protein
MTPGPGARATRNGSPNAPSRSDIFGRERLRPDAIGPTLARRQVFTRLVRDSCIATPEVKPLNVAAGVI